MRIGILFIFISSFPVKKWHGNLLPKLFWPTVRKNCSSDQEKLWIFFEITKGRAADFAYISESLEHFFLTVGQNNFCNKIPNHWKEDVKCFLIQDMRNLLEQVKKAFCYQKLFWPFTVNILFEVILQILGLQPQISKVFFNFFSP